MVLKKIHNICRKSKNDFANKVSMITEICLKSKRIFKKHIIHLQKAIISLYTTAQPCFKYILKKYSAGQPRPFRDAYTEFMHQKAENNDFEFTYDIANDIIINKIREASGIEFRNYFGKSKFGKSKFGKSKFGSPMDPKLSSLISDLPVELRVKIAGQLKPAKDRCNSLLKELQELLYLDGWFANTLPRFKKLLNKDPYLKTRILNKFEELENDNCIEFLLQRYPSLFQNFETDNMWFLYNLHKLRFKTVKFGVSTRRKNYHPLSLPFRGVPTRRRSTTRHYLPNDMKYEIKKQSIKKVVRNYTTPCLAQFKIIHNIFKSEHEIATTRMQFNKLFLRDQLTPTPKILFDAINYIRSNPNCLNFMKNIPKFNIAWDAHLISIINSGSPQTLLWELYQVYNVNNNNNVNNVNFGVSNKNYQNLPYIPEEVIQTHITRRNVRTVTGPCFAAFRIIHNVFKNPNNQDLHTRMQFNRFIKLHPELLNIINYIINNCLNYMKNIPKFAAAFDASINSVINPGSPNTLLWELYQHYKINNNKNFTNPYNNTYRFGVKLPAPFQGVPTRHRSVTRHYLPNDMKRQINNSRHVLDKKKHTKDCLAHLKKIYDIFQIPYYGIANSFEQFEMIFSSHKQKLNNEINYIRNNCINILRNIPKFRTALNADGPPEKLLWKLYQQYKRSGLNPMEQLEENVFND